MQVVSCVSLFLRVYPMSNAYSVSIVLAVGQQHVTVSCDTRNRKKPCIYLCTASCLSVYHCAWDQDVWLTEIKCLIYYSLLFTLLTTPVTIPHFGGCGQLLRWPNPYRALNFAVIRRSRIISTINVKLRITFLLLELKTIQNYQFYWTPWAETVWISSMAYPIQRRPIQRLYLVWMAILLGNLQFCYAGRNSSSAAKTRDSRLQNLPANFVVSRGSAILEYLYLQCCVTFSS